MPLPHNETTMSKPYAICPLTDCVSGVLFNRVAIMKGI